MNDCEVAIAVRKMANPMGSKTVSRGSASTPMLLTCRPGSRPAATPAAMPSRRRHMYSISTLAPEADQGMLGVADRRLTD